MKNGIASLLIELVGGRQYLIPQSMLAEIVPVEPLQPISSKEDWLLGKLSWRGRLPAVVDPARFCGSHTGDGTPISRFAVLYALEHLPGLSYYALPLASVPHPLRVTSEDLVIEPMEQTCELEGFRVRLKDQAVTLLDFLVLERRLASHLATA